MENKIITLTSEKFGKVRTITEGENVLFCASDVAKALGYKDTINATKQHCRGVVKRHPTIYSGRKQEINFILESDVYRLICHSKLPSALEFEKWVFEDVVPKAVDGNFNKSKENLAPEQLTLETAEYNYFPKTYNCEPVLTASDVEHFTRLNKGSIAWYLKRHGRKNRDYYLLTKSALETYKQENPNVSKMISAIFLITRSGFKKLMKHYDCKAETPKCFLQSKTPKLPEKATAGAVEISLEKQRPDPWEKYKKLGTYDEKFIDKLLSEHGVYCYGEKILPISVALDYFVSRAVATIADELYSEKGYTCKAHYINTIDLDDCDSVHTLRGFTKEGLRMLVTIHNIMVAGKVKFYDKGKIPDYILSEK